MLQHDKELIMPGDAAFNLECDFNKPRDIVVTADIQRYMLIIASFIKQKLIFLQLQHKCCGV